MKATYCLSADVSVISSSVYLARETRLLIYLENQSNFIDTLNPTKNRHVIAINPTSINKSACLSVSVNTVFLLARSD